MGKKNLLNLLTHKKSKIPSVTFVYYP